MSNESGMAAVDEAAATITAAQHSAAIATAREAGFRAGLAEGQAEARAEGAAAERARLAGIESAALPGHDALIAQCKADPTCTPGDAALRVNTAEREKIKAHGASIANVEKATGNVGAAVTTQPDAGTVTFPQTVDGWKAEYAANAKLQSEHVSADAYANWKQGVADGRVRIFTGNRR